MMDNISREDAEHIARMRAKGIDPGVGLTVRAPKATKLAVAPIALTFFDELAKPTPKPWLIKNVIACGETSSWIAPPGKGKSALLTDIAVHLAMGKDWRGYRTKTECGAVYFALERADLVRRRLVAHRLRDNLRPNLPIAVAGQIINLMHESCIEAIVGALRAAEDRFGCEVGLGIFDTYAKGIAAGGGDENLARDQNIALANLRRVIDRIGIHIATIGHRQGRDQGRARLERPPRRCRPSGANHRRRHQNRHGDQG
jgi:hypothetical protein